jgi:hypothetical protein
VEDSKQLELVFSSVIAYSILVFVFCRVWLFRKAKRFTHLDSGSDKM